MALNISSENFQLSLAYAIPLVALNSLSSVIGTVGNVLVIIVIVKSSALHRVTDYFILSLACADLIVGAVMEPLFTFHINYYTQTDGTTFDVVLDITGYVSTLASIGSILGVTFDRLMAIRFPLKYKVYLSKNIVISLITISWVFSTTFGIVFKLKNMHPALIWGACSLLLLGTLLSYPYIFYVARKQERQTAQLTLGGTASPANDANSKEPPTHSPRRIISEKKSAKTVATIVVVYGACWIPILVYTQVKMPVQTDANAFLPGFFIVYTLSMLNSTFNPYIYCVRNRRYRNELKALFYRRRIHDLRTAGTRAQDNKGQSTSL